MLKYIYLELLKTKRRRFFSPLIIFFVVGLLWSSVLFVKEYPLPYSGDKIVILINDLTIINSMFSPLIIGIMCSNLFSLEHDNQTFKVLQTNGQSIENLFYAKTIFAFLIILIFGLFQFFYINLIAILFKIGDPIYLSFLYFIGYIIASLFLIILHIFISLKIRKQSVGIIISLIASFVGLVSGGMLPLYLKFIIPWQYFSLLSPIHREFKSNSFLYSINKNFNILVLCIFILIIIELIVINRRIRRLNLC